MSETLTQKWLRQNVQAYANADRVFADVDATLARFPTLRPKLDAYTYDDGRTQLLLCLHNVIPISFRGASYNIPVAVWIPRDHPAQPPIVYVVPTSDMLVKAGKFVDVSGRCNLEYMQRWQRKSEGCSLSALVEAMQDQFSTEPPVYAKPKQAPPSPVSHSSGSHHEYAARPPPPLPQSSASHSPQPDRPLLPPKPGHTPQGPPPHSVAFQQARPPASLPPPQVPRSPAGPSDYNSTPHQYRGHDPRYQPPPPPPPPGGFQSPPPWTASPPPAPALHPVQQAPPPQPWLPTTPAPPAPLPNFLDEEDSGAEPSQAAPPQAVAPPRPPNPELLRLHTQVHEKLTSEMASLAQVLSLDAERLRAQQADLLLGEPAIRDEMARLEAVRDVCRNVSGRMRTTVDQAEHNMSELRRKGDPEVDELVCSTTIVHNQLINLVAEDNAIEDTIYHLHRALNSGRVDLERFLRTTRLLAEEQFLKRALIEKIQSGLPLGAAWT